MGTTLGLQGLKFTLDQGENDVFFQVESKDDLVCGNLSFDHIKVLAEALVHSIPVSEWAKYPKL